MNENLRRQIVREFPELAAGYHLPVMAEVIAVPDAPDQGGINDNYRPRYAVNVELLNTQYQTTEVKLNSVPVAISGGGDERGFFALPKRGTIVEVAWMNGSPERPFVRSILGDRQALPWIDSETMSWQQSESSFQRVDNAGNWQRQTDKTISDQSYKYEQHAQQAIITLGDEVRRVLQHSLEDIDGKKQIEATAIHLLSATVLNLIAAGSINQVAAEHITRSASLNITDHAKGSIQQAAEVDLIQQATKIYIGTETDNLLKLVSDSLQAIGDGFKAAALTTVVCAAPGSASSVPANAADFTAAATALANLKSKLDAMTK